MILVWRVSRSRSLILRWDEEGGGGIEGGGGRGGVWFWLLGCFYWGAGVRVGEGEESEEAIMIYKLGVFLWFSGGCRVGGEHILHVSLIK